MSDDWKQAWQPLIDAVGTDFGSDVEVWGADEVERSTIRRSENSKGISVGPGTIIVALPRREAEGGEKRT